MIFINIFDVNDYQNCFTQTDIFFIPLSSSTAIRFMINLLTRHNLSRARYVTVQRVCGSFINSVHC
jgi:hypothetical protein